LLAWSAAASSSFFFFFLCFRLNGQFQFTLAGCSVIMLLLLLLLSPFSLDTGFTCKKPA
jgi:hypothetical protein